MAHAHGQAAQPHTIGQMDNTRRARGRENVRAGFLNVVDLPVENLSRQVIMRQCIGSGPAAAPVGLRQLAILDTGERLPPEVKVGDTVVYSKYGGTEITLSGVDYVILDEDSILAIKQDRKKKFYVRVFLCLWEIYPILNFYKE